MKVLITGVTGQDGSYLVEYLLNLNLDNLDIGLILRRPVERSALPTKIKAAIQSGALKTFYGDIVDPSFIRWIFSDFRPDRIVNFAAQSHVGISYQNPYDAFQVNCLGVLNFLEVLREKQFQKIEFYQAGTSELFGFNADAPQNEKSILDPNSPYAIAKLAAHQLGRSYREGYQLKIWNGILFNHESPLRGSTFVTQKAVIGALRFEREREPLGLGNLDAVRDWGHARDYVRAIWMMMDHLPPGDYVVGTGVGHTVREMVGFVFELIGVELEWQGLGLEEVGVVRAARNNCCEVGDIAVFVSPDHFRPNEVNKLIADTEKISTGIDWKPDYDLKRLLTEMLEVQRGRLVSQSCNQ